MSRKRKQPATLVCTECAQEKPASEVFLMQYRADYVHIEKAVRNICVVCAEEYI